MGKDNGVYPRNLFLRFTDAWLAGALGPDGEQLELPGMPKPPSEVGIRMLPGQLVARANPDGYVVPGRARLARIFGVTEHTITRWFARLHRAGLIATVESAHRGRAAKYLLLIPEWGASAGTPLSKKGVRPQAPQSRERGASGRTNGVPVEAPPKEDEKNARQRARSDGHSGYRLTCPSPSADECGQAGQGVMCPIHGRELRALAEQRREATA